MSREATRARPGEAAPGRPAVAVVGGKLKVVRKARELGARVVHIQHPDRYDRAHWPYVDQALLVDYTDTARLLPLAAALHRAYPFDAVVSLTELGLRPAAQIDDLLGLGGTTLDTVDLLLDKWRMRRRLAALGLSPVAAALGRTEADLRAFAAAHGLPIVVKPTSEAGSLGVTAVRDAAGLAAVPARFRELARRHAGELAAGLDRFLMEEFLDGPEVSVETLSFDGRHVVVAVTDKLVGGPGFVELGHSTPSRHPAPLLRRVEDLVAAFLDAVGLRHGPAHTEVKLTGRGPLVVESHNRVGGDRINELTEVAYGVDMDRYALGARLGLVEPLPAAPPPRAAAAIRFLTPPPGRVVEVTGADRVRADPALVELELTVAPGAVVRPLTWSEDRAGHVMARGASAEEALAHCARLHDLIGIRTEAVT
ncbi:ATP-grasp domain-containing protein [Actinomadura sp. ATCC 31491]|uniref:ATP-grasp domain-containing protein n=1 Tax=Actinomadura luzonensis TaxID=2805427 RepID=A0ABT0FSZ4_9ACTN|nr:ATP-grasp domain-containing protein [Actinomadura luzonensis]MCK2215437.1 ATP-grasp domain-containing protein [Actinomadura luzonensis]